jgi:hypothetical protein
VPAFRHSDPQAGRLSRARFLLQAHDVEARLVDVLYQLEEAEPLEASLQAAIAARAPLAEIEALVKRKKTARA